MDLHRGFAIPAEAFEDVPTRAKHPAVDTAQSHKVCSAMRSLYTKAIGSLAGSVVVGGVLCQPAKADLRAISGANDIEGSRIELSSPDGYTCRFTDAERPSLSVGVGVAASPVIQGTAGNGYFSEGRLGEPQPIGGIVLRIPLGGAPNNCGSVMKVETAMLKVRRTQELYDLGLVTIEELQKISADAFAAIKAAD